MRSTAPPELTGTPPAVTAQQLREWGQLADDIDAALRMGGEQGMELLLSLMADWCAIADEVNSAYQTCCDLAGRGLRDEAIHWHAEGFFDIAERLNPDRPGWSEWAAALTEREVILPSIDIDTKLLVDRIFDDLQVVDIETNHSLADEIRGLRKNMLIRGRLDERLKILTRLRSLDPGVPTWQEMLRPYRKQRATEICAETERLIKEAQCNELCHLQAEVSRIAWEGDLPTAITTTLDAAVQWRIAAQRHGEIRHHATELLIRCQEARAENGKTPRYQSAIAAAQQHRDTLRTCFEGLQHAVSSAGRCQQIKKLVAAADFLNASQQQLLGCKHEFDWLRKREKEENDDRRFREIDAMSTSLIDSTPSPNHWLDFDHFKKQAKKWQGKAGSHLLNAKKLCSHAGDVTPPETLRLLNQVENAQREVTQHQQIVRRREFSLLFGVIVGIIIVVLTVFILIVIFSRR